ncbi:hypothetical protein D3273_18285 [Lichenibacterium minor]|uniref:Flagellar assembly protein FliH/Type III secretion system HrpE domain-containing protein n=1 Tax=Lichenibacterium minor TaxID=2316528 RepID=A0A4Q2U6I2_9HYPH|nr:hypothetical protein [Lichenibacterium minor]RYC30486.1 hypothetical protein D3273_18285 [Lichenibacterium minor]
MSALHRFLVEFDLDRPTLPRGAWPLLGREVLPVEIEPETVPDDPEPAVDLVAEAVAAALAEADAAHAAALAALAERHAAERDEARAAWAAAEGEALADGLRAGCAALEAALADGVAAALEPLLDEALRIAAVAQLRDAIGDLVLAGTGGTIAVAGPQDLLDSLRASLSRVGIAEDGIRFAPSKAAEVTVKADNSTIETRLEAWASALRRRMGDTE